MKQKTINIYKFEELKEEIQVKVLNDMRENQDLYFLDEMLNDELNILLKKNKIKVVSDLELRYSLSSCQGDGVSFTGLFKWKNYFIKIELGSNSNYYSHSNTTDIYIETQAGNEVKKEIEAIFKEIYKNICWEIEKYGYSLIEDANSDEYIKKEIDMNEYTFRSNGEIELI